MNEEDLKNLICLCITDIEFEYKGKHGSISPFSEKNIVVCYDGEVANCKNIKEVMEVKIFKGKSLKEIAQQIEIE